MIANNFTRLLRRPAERSHGDVGRHRAVPEQDSRCLSTASKVGLVNVPNIGPAAVEYSPILDLTRLWLTRLGERAGLPCQDPACEPFDRGEEVERETWPPAEKS